MLDTPNRGRHYESRLNLILSTCQDCGVLRHEETITHRDGSVQRVWVDDVTGAGKVVLTPRHEKYALTVSPRVLNRVKALAPQFSLALNVPSVSVEVEGGVVYVRAPRADAGQDVDFETTWRLSPIPQHALLLGLDDEGHQLVLPFDEARPHCAVVGMTGSGKTTLLRAMILGAILHREPVALFDPLALGPTRGLAPLSGHPCVWRGGVWQEPQACARALDALLRTHKGGRLFVFVDEVPDLLAQAPEAREALTRIAQRGRHTGLHLILGAQHPLASELPAMRNIPVRLVGKVADKNAAYTATGQQDSGCEALLGGGDFIAFASGRAAHFRAALIADKLLDTWQRQYPPRQARPLAGVVSMAPIEVEQRAVDAGEIGRPTEQPSEECVLAAVGYWREHGEPPSSNWIRRWTKAREGAVYGRPKAQRALDLAQARMEAT